MEGEEEEVTDSVPALARDGGLGAGNSSTLFPGTPRISASNDTRRSTAPTPGFRSVLGYDKIHGDRDGSQ